MKFIILVFTIFSFNSFAISSVVVKGEKALSLIKAMKSLSLEKEKTQGVTHQAIKNVECHRNIVRSGAIAICSYTDANSQKDKYATKDRAEKMMRSLLKAGAKDNYMARIEISILVCHSGLDTQTGKKINYCQLEQ